ncbi:2-succinyl-5-enolpyruvyl-6-hydroxy-3-cyclohexene-1-carboxylic-acid synthase [Chryseomicrobium palamuruense]|uniref:2-succinyl-5-enolpyruvyl-6-hydroxy-3-cyclohexene-1-carboxylate synthase n=1 Tax=Chryseomicrobium palamuruense TaxID=682973 RepID=A0ABV8UZ63_9BACL
MNYKEQLTHYVRSLLSGLKDYGVEEVVISPGSRSTPLAYGFVSDEDFKHSIQVDERSAAFFALGIAKASEKPVALLCTSGSAAANYFPALVEAYYARVPLIVLTADRPHELRQVGAPQTIDQVKLYGDHVKWFFDFPVADGHEATAPFVYHQASRGIQSSMTHPRGPVHFNIPFREPLMIDFAQKVPGKKPRTYLNVQSHLDIQAVKNLKDIVESSKKGIVVAGEILVSEKHQVESFLANLGWPVLADPLSNLRSTEHPELQSLIIENYDAILKNDTLYPPLSPDTVIRIGAQPVSKFLGIFLQHVKPSNFLIVDEHPNFRDALGLATQHLSVLPSALHHLSVTKKGHDTLTLWNDLNRLAREEVAHYIGNEVEEGAYVGTLIQSLPEESVLFTSSSMPIRDVDTFYSLTSKNQTVYANRGTNGIDGVVSTALGVQKALQKHVYLLIGDLAMLHDSNGLLLSRYQHLDATIVIVNNDGGGIFSYLPQSQEEVYFEKLFGTSSGLTFEKLAELYQLSYTLIDSKEQLAKLVSEPFKGLRILEVTTNRQLNTKRHRVLWQRIKEGGEKLL